MFQRCRSLPFSILFVIFLAVHISGCASLPVAGPLPKGVSIRELCRADEGTPLAWHPAGESFLFARGALHRYDLKNGSITPFATETDPRTAAWSPDGLKLAVSYHQGSQSLLRMLDSSGKLLAESKVEGQITNVAWRSEDEILAAAVAVTSYSFGANFSGILYRWDGKGVPASKALVDTTLKVTTAAMPRQLLLNTFSFALSPFGDELAYMKLIDPPQYPSRLKLMLFNLQTGAEREVPADIALTSGGAAFSANGEHLYYGDGFDTTIRLDPWSGAKVITFPSPGNKIALSPANLHALLDGTLFRKEKSVASFPASAEGVFSPDGTRLLLNYDNHLYLISGLNEPPGATMAPAVKERLLLLRKWRSEGLISVSEFEEAKGRLTQ